LPEEQADSPEKKPIFPEKQYNPPENFIYSRENGLIPRRKIKSSGETIIFSGEK
jgi:hypothetical protein